MAESACEPLFNSRAVRPEPLRRPSPDRLTFSANLFVRVDVLLDNPWQWDFQAESRPRFKFESKRSHVRPGLAGESSILNGDSSGTSPERWLDARPCVTCQSASLSSRFDRGQKAGSRPGLIKGSLLLPLLQIFFRRFFNSSVIVSEGESDQRGKRSSLRAQITD